MLELKYTRNGFLAARRIVWSAAIIAIVAFYIDQPAAVAADKITISVVNAGENRIRLVLRDEVCGKTVFQDRLDGGDSLVVEICANDNGVGTVGAMYGSGCSRVLQKEFDGLESGAKVEL